MSNSPFSFFDPEDDDSRPRNKRRYQGHHRDGSDGRGDDTFFGRARRSYGDDDEFPELFEDFDEDFDEDLDDLDDDDDFDLDDEDEDDDEDR